MPKYKVKNARRTSQNGGNFHLEFKNEAQGLAWASFKQHDVLFLVGPAGTGKSHLSVAFACEQILTKEKRKIILTRPIVEAGESLGYLPGEFEEKVQPYMMPMYDCIDKLVGREGVWRDKINQALEVVPLAYMRGRSTRLSEIVYTVSGPKKMGEIKVGDQVIGSDGNATKVIGVYPQGVLDVFRVEFTDNTEVICSGDHLWSTMTLNEKRHNKGYSAKSTKDISETVLNKWNQKIHRVPILSGPVQFESKDTIVDPYVLGCLLGDGSLGKTIKFTSSDEDLVEEFSHRLPEGNELVYSSRYDYYIRFNGNSQLKECLENMKLIGKKALNKFVPDDYKYNSPEVRLEILQGLMDTDGWICKHRSGRTRIQFCSISKRLAEDVMFLVRSLGGYAYSRLRKFTEKDNHVYEGKIIRHVHDAYVVDVFLEVCPFKLPRKAVQHINLPKPTKMIKAVIPCGKEECQCIQVDSSDHLYVTNGFTLTHNTFDDAVCIFDEAQNATMTQLKLFMTRFGEGSKLIINGDPTQSDLAGDVALTNVMHRLSDVQGIGSVQFKANSIVRHPLVSKIIEKLES